MNILLPKMLNKPSSICCDSMEIGKVYQFGRFLTSEAITGCIIAVDVIDNDILTFNDSNEFCEWLSDNDHPTRGDETPYQMQIIIK